MVGMGTMKLNYLKRKLEKYFLKRQTTLLSNTDEGFCSVAIKFLAKGYSSDQVHPLVLKNWREIISERDTRIFSFKKSRMNVIANGQWRIIFSSQVGDLMGLSRNEIIGLKGFGQNN